MFVGFLVSRVALSISMFLLGVNAIRDIPPRQWFKNKWWLLGVLWVLTYVITYFWSEDKHNWDTRWQTKLPFLLLPLAYAYMPKFTPRQLQFITISTGAALMCSAIYSLSFLITEPATYIAGYKISVVLPTLPKEDHVRASLSIALYLIWCVYLWPRIETRSARMVTGSFMLFLVIFLHILAAKNGLISLYLFLALYGLYLAVVRRKVAGVILVIAIPVTVMLGIRFVPTLRERANYIGYTIFMFQHGDNSGNFGDINRLYSYNVAIQIIKDHPLTGVGTGDMLTMMDKVYARMYPNVPDGKVLLPHNQFLVVALGCGIPAMILFIIWILMPLAQVKRNRESFFFVVVWLVLLLQLMIEPVLEVQIGVFVFLYFLLLQRHEMLKRDEPYAPALTS